MWKYTCIKISRRENYLIGLFYLFNHGRICVCPCIKIDSNYPVIGIIVSVFDSIIYIGLTHNLDPFGGFGNQMNIGNTYRHNFRLDSKEFPCSLNSSILASKYILESCRNQITKRMAFKWT